MREILSALNNKNHLTLGKYCFSPLMELSGGIVLDYCDKIYTDKCERAPFISCFPQKKGAALWISIIALTNAFLDDHINNIVDGIQFEKGDKVKIFNSVAEIERVTHENIYLKFKDQGGIPINSRLRGQLSRVGNSRALSLKKKFSKNYFELKNKRNPISKILIPNDAEIINQNNLDSKVLLISGRGNIKGFYKLLDDSVFYEEKLSKTFGLGKNLIIKPDLKPFIHFFDKEIKLKLDSFVKLLIKLSQIASNDAFINESVSAFLDRLDNENGISIDFEIDFLSFVEEYEGEFEEQLSFIVAKFPGVQESLPTKLKAVVINDIRQINEYSETINGFLALKIPVVVVSNRNVTKVSDIEFYNNLFKNNPEYYRINWNRKKIQYLIECASELNFIDNELWGQSKRYASQQIKISVTEGCELDILIGQLLSNIKELDEFERLQKAFYKYFYPALYALKNSNSKTAEVTNLISEFKYIFEGIKGGGLPKSTIVLFDKGIRIAYDYVSNSKEYDPRHNIFSNHLPALDLNHVYIPCEMDKKNLPTSKKSKLIFTGYPYQEYSGKFLLNSVCVDFIPDVEILCWPNEGSLTNNYLNRRLIAGYFTDNIIGEYDFPSNFLLKETNEFTKEIESFLSFDSNIQTEEDQEQEADLAYLHTFKYKGYSNTENSESIFKVKCNTLNFKDESFMFLPKKSSILAEAECEGNDIKVANLKFSQISVGLRVFKYQKDRTLFKDIAKKNVELKNAYDNLEIWREKLGDIFVSCKQNVGELFELLKKAQNKFGILDAKPTKGNLRNWLFDEDMIMPDHANVQLILSAAFDSDENIEGKVNNLQSDYLSIKAHRIQLSHKIKKTIAQQFVNSGDILDGEINIAIEGINISVDVKTIESLDQSDIEIEYHHTRKILC
jgi:hypothetical protein